MGWSIGFDSNWQRDVGYGVPAYCDYPGCLEAIDRGLSYVCGGEPYGGDDGCGLYFCSQHLFYTANGKPQRCERCCDGEDPFDPSPEHPRWMQHILTDDSWQRWRDENPDKAAELRKALDARILKAQGSQATGSATHHPARPQEP